MKVKKLFCILAALLILAMIPVTAMAAPADDIIAAAKAKIPAEYNYWYLVELENVLPKLNITQAQADQVIECINTASGLVTVDRGHTLHLYTSAERKALLAQFDKACDILGVTYRFETTNRYHKGDIVCYIYDSTGKMIAKFDGDIVNRTDGTDFNYTAVTAVSGVLIIGLIAALYFSRKTLAAGR